MDNLRLSEESETLSKDNLNNAIKALVIALYRLHIDQPQLSKQLAALSTRVYNRHFFTLLNNPLTLSFVFLSWVSDSVGKKSDIAMG